LTTPVKFLMVTPRRHWPHPTVRCKRLLTMPLRDWKAALNRFTIQFEERMPENQCSPRLHKIRDTLWQRVTTESPLNNPRTRMNTGHLG
jgi:hypothetical protein